MQKVAQFGHAQRDRRLLHARRTWLATRAESLKARWGGFTLLEVLVALLIFAFGLLAVAALVLTSIQSIGQARHMTDATNLAQQRMEALTNTPYASVVTGAHANNPITVTGAAGGIYTSTWTVTDNTPATGMKRVTVTTSWTDKDGTHSVALHSILSP